MSWLTTKHAADYLGIGKATLNRYRQGQNLPIGALPPQVSIIGRIARYRTEWLDEFMLQFDVDPVAEMDRIVDEIWEKINERK